MFISSLLIMDINTDQQDNYSYTLDESTTVTMTMIRDCTLPLEHGVVLIIFNGLLSIVGTFGNILIIMAVLNTPRLRQKPSNFLLLSLAVADLLVTMVAQPLFVTSMCFKTFASQCVDEIDRIYVITAPLAACSSVFHLAAVSIDRAISALRPHKHHYIVKKGFKPMLVVCWGMAALAVCILGLYPAATSSIYIALLLCLVIMMAAYGMILYKICVSNRLVHVTSRAARERAMERRVSGTVAIIIVLFAVCWIPLISFHLSEATSSFMEKTYWWIRTLYLANSSMNFIVYSLRIKQFRSAYLKVINKGLQRFGEMLPEKCRCQCLYAIYERTRTSSAQSTQNTPVSPNSTGVTFQLNVAPKEEKKEQMKS